MSCVGISIVEEKVLQNNMDGLVQDCGFFLAMELLQTCTKLLISSSEWEFLQS